MGLGVVDSLCLLVSRRGKEADRVASLTRLLRSPCSFFALPVMVMEQIAVAKRCAAPWS